MQVRWTPALGSLEENTKLKTLYVIGNGFDLYHELPTKYSDFNNYIKKINVVLYNALENCCKFDYKWRDFEDKLSTFSITGLTKYNSEFIENDGTEYTLSAILEQAKDEIKYLPNALNNWIIETIKYPDIEEIENPVDFQEDALFLTFNYTKTLENIYDINNVWHIHGSPTRTIKNRYDSFPDEKESADLVVGFDENKNVSIPDSEFENQICGTNFDEVVSWLKKPTHSIITMNKAKFDEYSNVEKVIILGHSLGDCDIPYFQEIENRITPNATFEISYYDSKEKQDLQNQCRKFVKNHKVSFKEFEEFCKDFSTEE